MGSLIAMVVSNSELNAGLVVVDQEPCLKATYIYTGRRSWSLQKGADEVDYGGWIGY